MKKNLVRLVAIITMTILLVSNISVFAAENTYKGNDRNSQNNQIREYVKVGEISEIHPNNIVIGEKSGKVIFRITTNTSIKDEKQNEIRLSDLKVGMGIEVTYDKTSNSKADKSFEAKSIQVMKNVNEISNAVVQDITIDTKNTLFLTVLFETIDSKNRIVENTMDLVVDNNTEIVNQFGVKAAKSELKVGMVLDVEHSKAVTKSYVPQAYCNSIDIVKQFEDSDIIEANILEKEIHNNVAYVLVGNADKVSEQILLVLSDNTALKDQNGINIAYAQLEVGQKIKAEYSLTMTKSLPAQAQAYSIQIIDKKAVPSIKNATILDVDLKNNDITVSYEVKYGEKVYEKTIILLIDNDTVIKNELGKTIDIAALKVGMTINAKHAEATTLGLPPTAKAYLIEVVDTKQSVLIENATIDDIDLRNKNITVSYDVKYGTKVYEETIVLLVDRDTVIKNELGKAIALADLKVGMMVNAKHAEATTLGLPPTAKAYLIEVVDTKQSVLIENATIDDIDLRNKNITVSYDVKYGTKVYEETIVLLVDKDTVIKNELGKAIALTDLEIGMTVNAKRAVVTTLGLPPTAKAYSIEVVDNKQTVLIENATIDNVDLRNDRITVTYEEKFKNKVYEETMILLIDNNTIIKDSKGKSIGLKDLEVGMTIDAKHALSATLSMPPMSLAYSIDVISAVKPPVNGDLKDIYELLDKLFKELGVDNWSDYIKDGKFDWDIDDDDDLEDIIEDIVEQVLGDDYDDDDDEDMEDKIEDLIEKLIKEMKGNNKNFKNNKR